jgi:predicted amidohydrolase YtcJ
MAVALPPARLLTNGGIHTHAGEAATAEALLIVGDRVLAAGTRAELRSHWPGPAEVIDLRGRTVFPGLCDAHLHLEKYARAVGLIDCGTSTRRECLERVRQKALGARRDEWILGHGWNQNDWDGHGTAAELDAVAPDNPTYLTAKSLHAAWANRRALQLAGVEARSTDPPGGAILRQADGAPSGILLEAAMSLVAERIPEPTAQSVAEEIRQAQPRLWQAGITAIHDFDGPRCLRALQLLRAQEGLGLRVLKSIPVEYLEQALALGLQSGFGDEWIRIGHVKVFADGALGPRTAAMLQPYDGEPDNLGMLLVDREGVLETGMAAARGGLPLAIHAIGDRANHEVLEGLASLRRYEVSQGIPPLRHRIEHVQVLHPDDVPRLARLGLVASMQPIHATSDMVMAERYWGGRNRFAYAWRSQLQQGALLAFGSDAPVESPNPFLGLHAAVTRRRSDGSPGPNGWIPEERLRLEEALRAFTEGPAIVAGVADRIGRLDPGCLADLIVLEQDPYKTPPHELASLRPSATMVSGRWVHPEDEP